MSVREQIESPGNPCRNCEQIGAAVHAALGRGLVIGRQVRVGMVPGVVIGYNIARGGRYPGTRYPLLLKTELGVAKCRIDEVVPT